MKSGIVFGAVGLGFALLIASNVWATLFPPTLRWTPEKDQRMSEVKERLNNLSFMLYNATNRMHSGSDAGPLKAEYDGLLREFEQLKTDFESASQRPQTVSTVLRWAGIAVAGLGILGYFAVREA